MITDWVIINYFFTTVVGLVTFILVVGLTTGFGLLPLHPHPIIFNFL